MCGLKVKDSAIDLNNTSPCLFLNEDIFPRIFYNSISLSFDLRISVSKLWKEDDSVVLLIT